MKLAATLPTIAVVAPLWAMAPAQDPKIAATRPAEAAATLAVRGLQQDDPFKLVARLSETALTVELDIAPGWHLYGRDTGGGAPVRVEVLKGSSFEAAGALQAPMDAKGEITGKAKLVLPLRRTAPGHALRARFAYMACDALQCLPPREVSLETRLRVLVVSGGQEDSRVLEREPAAARVR